jgi:putative ABC transport system permease protein
MLLADTVTISLPRLSIALVPVVAFLFYLYFAGYKTAAMLQGLARMLIQLLAVGYLLVFLFQSDSGWVTSAVMSVMLLAASWIALRSTKEHGLKEYSIALLAITVGGGATLLLMTQFVLSVDPWYLPKVVIPLAGMSFSSSMNAVALAAERLERELEHQVALAEAVRTSMATALIPITNSLYAVGVVSIPGMMTGQVLAGVSPLIAARYQIMIMCMLVASSGFSVAIFLRLRESLLMRQR